MKRILTLLFILTPFVLYGQSVEEQVTEKLEVFVKESRVPGLAMSVSQKGELVYSKGFGYADLEAEVPVDPAKTQFRIGSVSKTVTAAGLALLYEQGKIDLDVPIEKYVPMWPQKKHKITLRLLAGHLAGIRHYKPGEFQSSKNYPTVTDGLAIFMNDPLINKPGTEYSYSSYGWNLISVAMEKANASGGTFLQTGQDFLQFMQESVFDALEMNNTVAEDMLKEWPNRTKFYVRSSRGNESGVRLAPVVDNSYKWAGGGFIGTTEDLCKFGQAHMKAGFLKQSTLDEWMRSQKMANGKDTNYGIGWRTYKRHDGNTYYGHSGGSVGGSTMFLIHKDSETVLAITGNISNLSYNGIYFDLIELFIDK